MRDLSQGKFRQQITFLRRQFLQEGDLPFRDVLSEELVQDALAAVRVVWNDTSKRPWSRYGSFSVRFLAQIIRADQQSLD